MRFLSLLPVAFATLPHYAYGYCVYNKHSDDTHLRARQYKFNFDFISFFDKQIYPPDGKECCPYTSSDCSPNVEDPNTVIKLYINRINNVELDHFSVTLPAGGWVVVDGDKGKRVEYNEP
ncbi:hypothetical protein BJV82DRAFT_583899 [Fennellomyces sp. T-0311]|nr:hypothetical protein BJV82DRAFT_583899 [Fennellomyces sp. T-0311]